MTAPPRFAAGSTIRLWPFVVKGRAQRYTVINRQGGQAISTSEAGVAAMRLLSSGRTVEHTRRILGQRYGHPEEDVDLEPLLHTLYTAGFVRALNGEEILGPAAPRRPGLRLWLTLFLWSPLLDLALQHLPPRLALPLAYRWLAPPPSPELAKRIAANLRRAPDLDGTDRAIAKLAARNRDAQRKHFCDRLLLGSLTPRRLRRWLGREVRVSGLEHLVRARAGGTGMILCSLHLGSYGLIPFVLGARGVPVTVYGTFGEGSRADVEAWLAQRGRCGDPYPVSVAAGPMGLRTLMRCLERGDTALLYCDQAPGEAGSAPSPRGWIQVPFLGTRIWSPRGIGWLRQKTAATVLPVALFWQGRGGHRLVIGPPIHFAPSLAPNVGDAVVTSIYGALEPYVRQDPAQWLKWAEFDEMMSP